MAFPALRRTRLGSLFSEGSRLLRQVIEGRRWSMNEAARQVDATTGMLAQWLFGDRRPGLEWAIKLRDLLGIPVDAWVQPAQAPAEAAG